MSGFGVRGGDPAAQRGLVNRYEALRGDWLRGGPVGGRRGVALVLNQGMTAWIDAWLSLPEVGEPAPHPRRPLDGRGEPELDMADALPGGFQAEVANVLAGMALVVFEAVVP